MAIPDRANNRDNFGRKGGVVSAAEIMANIASSGVKDDSPDNPKEDNKRGIKSPTYGIRNDSWVREQHAKGKRVGDE